MKPNLIYIERGIAYIATPERSFYTLPLGTERYVRIDDRKQYPQLCSGAHTTGGTLIYHNDEQLARECKAKLFKTRKGFDEATARLQADAAWYDRA